jgi:citrate synthase
MATAEKSKAGLEDIVATSSAICYLDGDRGVLAYCGYDIHDLAQSATFEEVCFLLWHRRLPTRADLGDLQSQLAASRQLKEPIIRLMRKPAARERHGCIAHRHVGARALRIRRRRDITRGAVSQGRPSDRADRLDSSRHGDDYRRVADRLRPDPAMGHAANFLYMLTGERPNSTAIRAFDIALTLHADHELNASTFAARVAAATLTDIYSAMVAAVGTLKGPLHGGANAEVMKMLLELGQTASGDRVDEFVRGKLARKEKIPGFGHRVYKTEDPRATHLRQMSRELGKRGGNTAWFDMSQRIEALVKGEKKLNPNVDFYSASTYYALGIPIDLYTPIFAVSRISGWTAHVLEPVRQQPSDPPARGLHRAIVSTAVRSARASLALRSIPNCQLPTPNLSGWRIDGCSRDSSGRSGSDPRISGACPGWSNGIRQRAGRSGRCPVSSR